MINKITILKSQRVKYVNSKPIKQKHSNQPRGSGYQSCLSPNFLVLRTAFIVV